MKRLVIFDLDGTLLNTVKDLAVSTNYALQQCGYPTHPVEAYYMFVGNGINKLFERALPQEARTPENVLKMRAQFVPYYNKHYIDFTEPYSGIPELLATLQKNKIQLAVASNKYQSATEHLIVHFFPDITFAAVFGQREGKPIKPDATVVNDILTLTNCSKEETVYVGDSCVDMQTAHNAAVTLVGVTWGFRPREELEAYSPDFLIDTPQEMLEKNLFPFA